MELSLIQQICVWALPVLFAITVHEVAHGWVARRCGDPTAFMLGRLTLNPIRHIDPIGTVLLPMLLLSMGGIIFGWAKPVPVNPRYFQKPRRDTALVAIAGPFSNFIMAIGWAGVAVGGQSLLAQDIDMGLPMLLMGDAGIKINLLLGILNVLPIPPLDGSRVVSSFLPTRAALTYNRLEPYGFFILIALLFVGVLGAILSPLYLTSYYWIIQLFGLN